jgi:translation initiation factor IF-3
MAKPPVCKIMDYGKFKYEAKKKANEAKKKQVVVKLKEIKLRPRTEEHDYDVKLRQAREFLEEGHKVKVTIVFRGREIAHREIGQKQLQEMVADLKDVGVVEQAPRMEGKAMFMLLGANPKGKAPAPRPSGPSASGPSGPRPAGAPGSGPSAPRPPPGPGAPPANRPPPPGVGAKPSFQPQPQPSAGVAAPPPARPVEAAVRPAEGSGTKA